MVLKALDILQNAFGLRNVILPLALDKSDPYSYINNVREPDSMPDVGWERHRSTCGWAYAGWAFETAVRAA